ncbi:MAG: class I SAM-dependent methyltransferase [Oligoflexia bacterium]|nr:class I SAM-dependent methyltransferase [Oligoflexia bacterium]
MKYHTDLIDGKLQLVFEDKNFTPLFVDFATGSTGYRIRHPSYELIYAAIGKAKGLKVLDATAGWGTDAFILANLECKVTALENNDIVFRLLQDGLRRASDVATRIHLLKQDFFEFAKTTFESFDVIYLDPMFDDDEDKTALPKKEMQVLKELVGTTQDAHKYLEVALNMKPKRVVLKRPLKAPQISNPKFSVEGSSIRFDIY